MLPHLSRGTFRREKQGRQLQRFLVGRDRWNCAEPDRSLFESRCYRDEIMPTINAAGLALIKSFEGCELTAYSDVAGILTIGWGHTGPDVYAGQTITQEEADALLLTDLQEAEEDVQRFVEVQLTPNEFSALVSFQYNTGALSRSTLLVYLNRFDFDAASAEFLKWVWAAGEIQPGLVRRRQAERALFDQGRTSG